MNSSYIAASKLNTHAMRSLASLALAVLFLYITIGLFIGSTFTETGTSKTITVSIGFVSVAVGTAFGILAYLQWRKPAVYTLA